MKNWFAKFKISAALDASPATSPDKSSGSTNEEVRRFETSLKALDRRLKSAAVSQPVPAGLHAGTMQALRAVRVPKPAARPNLLRWWPAPALAALIIFSGWLALSRFTPHKPQAAHKPKPNTLTVAINSGRNLTQAAPSEALAPLAKELDLLNLDLRNALNFLVASVP